MYEKFFTFFTANLHPRQFTSKRMFSDCSMDANLREQWPSGMGFQYFYGFQGCETDPWRPYLFRDHAQVFPWVGKPGYNLATDLADDAIR
jgi:hypothetical protein